MSAPADIHKLPSFMDTPNTNKALIPADYSAIERALRASYEATPLLMGTVELLPDGDLLHLYDNPATDRFFGNVPGSTSGRTARTLGIPAATLAVWRARYDAAVASGSSESFEYVHDTGSGARSRILAVTVAPLDAIGPNAGPTCCYIAEDVSERRRAEILTRQAIESTSDGVFVLSRDWHFELMNANAMALVADGRDLTGQNIWEVFPDAVGGPYWQAYHRCMAERVPTEAADYYAPLARSFAARAFPLEGGGITVYFQDVTASREAEARLRESEARLSAVLDALPVGVIIADETGRLVRDNAANRAIWGVPPETVDWKKYADWEGYWPDSGRRIEPHEWAMSRALLKSEVVRGELVECQPFDGGPRRYFLNNAAPVRDTNGRIVGGVVAELDVTDQRQAEAALARSNAQARAAAESVQLALAAGAIAGTWDWNLQTGCIAVDERFAESFGIDPALGRAGLRLEQVITTVHPDDLADLSTAIKSAIQRGGPYRHEYRVRGRDGVYHWIEANGRVDLAADGTPLRFPGVLLDLERRRAVEAERDRATQLLRAFIDAVPGVVYAKDSEGRMLVANRGVTELVGKPPESYLGKTDLEFLDNKDQAERVMATDRRIMESGVAETVEEEINFADGRRAVWLSTKEPFRDAQGRVIGLIGSSVDITVRQQAEAALRERTDEVARSELRLQVALTAGRMGVWEWIAATGETIWSPQMLEILGLPPDFPAHATADTFMQMVHPQDRPVVDAALARSLNDGSDFEAEMRIVRGDGQIKWLLGRGHVLRDEQGRPARMVGVNVDINERKEVEQALLEADRRRNEFLAMLGHELRNPLAPITTAVHLLELAGGEVDRRNAAVQIIRRQAEHMARLVDDLLEVSRVTQGRIELRKENILVASAVFSALETVRPLVRQRAQTLEVDVSPDIDLLADQARLTQIVANLLNNASKYTQTGGHISVRAQACVDDDSFVEIIVADNGPGIEETLLPRVFDLFSQASTTIDRSRGGLGLGLALVKRLVELHDGQVRAESAGPGKGATFTVRLPGMARRAPLSGAPSSSSASAVPPTTILVVDDNVDALETLSMLLEAGGHQVERARDGEEALLVARRFAPRVVLLDLGLPKLDGWEVARRLRADHATARAVVIAISGYGQASDRERSRDAGFDGHLLKPANLDAVYDAVAVHIDRIAAS